MALARNVNFYDVQKECNGGLCYDFSNMENYLSQGSIRDALGVGSRKSVSCSPLVYEAMLIDWMRNIEVGIPTLLEDGVKLLVYAGEYDLIRNWLGNSIWVNSMDWSGSENFKKAPTRPFLVDDKEAGLITSYGTLNFLKVHDAGHMVPMDQPKAALEMLKCWTQGSITDDNSQILQTMTEMPEKNFEKLMLMGFISFLRFVYRREWIIVCFHVKRNNQWLLLSIIVLRSFKVQVNPTNYICNVSYEFLEQNTHY